MKNLILIILIIVSGQLFGQTEPKLHPAQVGTYGAATNSIMVANGTSGSAEYKTAATLGLDASTTNEIQTVTASGSGTTYAIDLSLSGGSVGLIEGSFITIDRTGNDFTISAAPGSEDITNEGALTVAAGTSTTSIINSNTSGSTGVTLSAGTGMGIGESGNVITLTNSAPDQTVSITSGGINATTGTYPNFTITATEVDGSVTNELQTVSRGSLTVNTITLSNSGGTVNVEDELTIESFTPSAAATTVVTTLATPVSENKIRIERNGVVQNVGAGLGVSGITNEGNTATVITFTRAFSTGEQVRVIWPKQ